VTDWIRVPAELLPGRRDRAEGPAQCVAGLDGMPWNVGPFTWTSRAGCAILWHLIRRRREASDSTVGNPPTLHRRPASWFFSSQVVAPNVGRRQRLPATPVIGAFNQMERSSSLLFPPATLIA
jgi:hypothetical protein